MRRGPDELREIALKQKRVIQPLNGAPHVCVATQNEMDRWEPVLAEKDGLAVHRGMWMATSRPCHCRNLEPDEEPGFHVAHVASGLGVLCLPTLKQAIAAMHRLAPLTNWNVTAEEVRRMPDADLAAVARAIAEIENTVVH